eukprot:3646702-Rhodomonas_salina.2
MLRRRARLPPAPPHHPHTAPHLSALASFRSNLAPWASRILRTPPPPTPPIPFRCLLCLPPPAPSHALPLSLHSAQGTHAGGGGGQGGAAHARS